MDTYGWISKLYIIQISIYLFFRLTDKVRGTKTEQSDVATYGGIFKLFIVQIRFYLFFRFTENVRGTKTEQSHVAMYGGKFVSIYFYGYGLSSQLWIHMAGYLKYISSRYVFISSFVSLTNYVGQKLNNMMWLRIAGEFMPISIFWVRLFG